jgi:serine/threonine protein phosphatase PrpC
MKVTHRTYDVEEMVLMGVISVREARNHPRATSSPGRWDIGVVEIDLLRFRVLPTDVFLLCCDGFQVT